MILDYYLIAKIEQIYRKNGFVKLKLYSDFPERYFHLEKVFIDFWGDKKIFYVDSVEDVNGKIVIKFKNFDSTRDSQVLIGREVFVAKEDLVRLPENHFFIHDLIGSEVIVDKERLGVVEDVIKGKANDILMIRTDSKEEKMIPFVLKFIEKFDASEKQLILNISKDFFEEDED